MHKEIKAHLRNKNLTYNHFWWWWNKMFGVFFIFKGYFNRILVHLVPIPHAYVDILEYSMFIWQTCGQKHTFWPWTYFPRRCVRPYRSVFLPAHCFVWSNQLTWSAPHRVRLQWTLTCLDVFSLWCVKQILEKRVNVFDSCCCLCSSLWSFPDRGRLWSAMSTHLEAKWPLTAIQPICHSTEPRGSLQELAQIAIICLYLQILTAKSASRVRVTSLLWSQSKTSLRHFALGRFVLFVIHTHTETATRKQRKLWSQWNHKSPTKYYHSLIYMAFFTLKMLMKAAKLKNKMFKIVALSFALSSVSVKNKIRKHWYGSISSWIK